MRLALQESADRLFAARGFAATTVRDIAEEAGVTERTFFRYFTGKEDLIIDDALSWVHALAEMIRTRPGSEDPITAVRRAVLDLITKVDSDPRGSPLATFDDGPEGGRLARSTRRALHETETILAEVIGDRLERFENAGARLAVPRQYLAELLSRLTVAAMRSALLEGERLRREGKKAPAPRTLLAQAFKTVHLPLAEDL